MPKAPFFVFTLAVAFAGQSDSPDLILRSSTRLVQVSVVASDRKGHPVLDLTKEDFALFDNKKRQEIRVFSLDRVQNAEASAPTERKRAFTNAADERSITSGITVIVLDSINTKWTDQAQAARQVLRFLQQQVQPDDRIAVYAISRGGFRILHDFTRDASDLVELLSGWRGEIPPPAGKQTTADLGDTLGRVLQGRDSQRRASQMASRDIHDTLGTLAAFKDIARHLERIPRQMRFHSMRLSSAPVRVKRSSMFTSASQALTSPFKTADTKEKPTY